MAAPGIAYHNISAIEPGRFEDQAIELFQLQYQGNPIYKNYVDALGIIPSTITRLESIPFLPIRFFKTHKVQTGEFAAELVFESSGTSGTIPSYHYIKDAGLYRKSFLEGFKRMYGDPADYCIIGLLPSYLERQNSSLVYMVNELIRESNHPQGGFYLGHLDRLRKTLDELSFDPRPCLLIGVSFALLDFAEQFPGPLSNIIIMETGGMKGRRKELVRAELYDRLKTAFSIQSIHSEYGMTELLSQAYSKGEGLFQTPPWMKIMLRDEEDPLTIKTASSANIDKTLSGAINVIDLANIHSCCFIATEDAGQLHPDGSFEVLGRIDHSDIRGCSLMAV